jgi:hypothetical protein
MPHRQVRNFLNFCVQFNCTILFNLLFSAGFVESLQRLKGRKSVVYALDKYLLEVELTVTSPIYQSLRFHGFPALMIDRQKNTAFDFIDRVVLMPYLCSILIVAL